MTSANFLWLYTVLCHLEKTGNSFVQGKVTSCTGLQELNVLTPWWIEKLMFVIVLCVISSDWRKQSLFNVF